MRTCSNRAAPQLNDQRVIRRKVDEYLSRLFDVLRNELYVWHRIPRRFVKKHAALWSSTVHGGGKRRVDGMTRAQQALTVAAISSPANAPARAAPTLPRTSACSRRCAAAVPRLGDRELQGNPLCAQ